MWPRNTIAPLTCSTAYMRTCCRTMLTSSEAPGNSLLWGLGALEDSNRERTRFLIMPKRPHEWYVDAHGCYKFNNADLALGPRDTTSHLPAFLHLRTTNFRALTVSRAVNRLTRGAWNAKSPSMSVDKAAGNSHSLQHPDLLVPSLRENIACVALPWRLLTQKSSICVQQAHSKPPLRPLVTMKQVRAVLQEQMR